MDYRYASIKFYVEIQKNTDTEPLTPLYSVKVNSDIQINNRVAGNIGLYTYTIKCNSKYVEYFKNNPNSTIVVSAECIEEDEVLNVNFPAGYIDNASITVDDRAFSMEFKVESKYKELLSKTFEVDNFNDFTLTKENVITFLKKLGFNTTYHENNIENFGANDFKVEVNLLKGMNIQSAIHEVLSLCGAYLIEEAFDKFSLKTIKTKGKTIQEKIVSYKDCEIKESVFGQYGVNTFTLALHKDIDGEGRTYLVQNKIDTDGIIEYKIIDNHLVFDDNRKNALMNNVDYPNSFIGYQYQPFNFESKWIPSTTIGDCFEVQTSTMEYNNETGEQVPILHNSIVTIYSLEYVFDGGMMANFSAGEFKNDYTKPIYNHPLKELINRTEISVDKIKQEISSVVEKTTENESNITKLTQDIDKLTLTITDGGGANLLKNSVGYAGVKFWESTKGIETEVSTWFLENTTSKHGFVLSPQEAISTTLKQTVQLKKDTEYTVNFKLNREQDVNRFMVKLISGSGEVIEVLDNQPNTEVGTQHKLNFNTNQDSEWRLEISLTKGGSKDVEISDIGIYEGRNVSTWQQNAGETYTLNIQQDSEGITVFSSDGKSKTVINPQEFAGYYNDRKIFTLNGDLTQIQALEIMGGGLLIRPIRIVQSKERNALIDVWVGWK